MVLYERIVLFEDLIVSVLLNSDDIFKFVLMKYLMFCFFCKLVLSFLCLVVRLIFIVLMFL